MERKEHDCCVNCEFRDEKTSHCSEVLEPLRQEYGFEGPESIHVALNNYCLMFQPSEEYGAEELEAEKERAAERGEAVEALKGMLRRHGCVEGCCGDARAVIAKINGGQDG
jgi:hypothetical protein